MHQTFSLLEYFILYNYLCSNLLTLNRAKPYQTTDVVQLYRQDDPVYLLKHRLLYFSGDICIGGIISPSIDSLFRDPV